MKKSTLSCHSLLVRAMMLFALLAVSVGAKAQDIPVLSLDTEYTVPMFESPTYSFTATESGKVYMYSTTQDFPQIWKDSACTNPYNVELNPYHNPRWSMDVVAGTTYYIGYGTSFTMSETTFWLTMNGPSGVEVVMVDPELDSVLTVGYPISIGFSVPVAIEAATFEGGTAAAKDVVFNIAGANASFEVKELLYKAMTNGEIKPGDDVKLTLTGVHANDDPSLMGGDNGTMVFSWKACPMPVALVNAVLPDFIIPKWEAGDAAGIAVFEFSGALSQGAAASLTNGDLSKGGTYEELPVRVDGTKVYVDFTGVQRFPAVTDTYVLDVYNVTDAAGYPAYSPGEGSVGSYTYTIDFDGEPLIEPIQIAISPAAGTNLEGVEDITVLVTNATSSFQYTGAEFEFISGGAKVVADVAKADIEEHNNGTEISLIVAVPGQLARADAGSDVTFRLVNESTILASAAYTYGTAQAPETLNIQLVSPADGSTLAVIGADESILLNITGIPANTDVEIQGTIVDNESNEAVKWCFFFPEEGENYNYGCMMYDDVDLYEGHTYTLTIDVVAFPLDEQGFRGTPVDLGSASFTYYGAGTEYKYSDAELIGIDPDPSTTDITSLDQNVVTVTFSAPVSVLRVVQPLGFGGGTIDYTVAKANEAGTEWTFTIPESTLSTSKGTFTVSMYAQDAEGLYIWKSALWDDMTWTGVPDAMKAKDETYFSLLFNCTLGSPDIEVTPADGSVVTSLDKFVVGYSQGINCSWSTSEDIVLYKGEGEDKEELQRWTSMYFDPWENTDMAEKKNGEIIAWTLLLDEPQTTDCVLTLCIPNMFFYLGTEFNQANSKAQTVTVTVKKTEGIESVSVVTDDGTMYNVAGLKVDSNYKGIVIKNGKKLLNR